MPKHRKVSNNPSVQQVPVISNGQNLNLDTAPGAGSLDNHEIVQLEGVDISQYRRLNIPEVPTEELERRIAEANKVNANSNLVREKYEEAADEVKKEVEKDPNKYKTNKERKKEILKKTLSRVLGTVGDCKIFTYTDGNGEKWVGPVELFSPDSPQYRKRATQIRKCAIEFSEAAASKLTTKESTFNELTASGVLKEGDTKVFEDFDFEKQEPIKNKAHTYCPSNWFDASQFAGTKILPSVVNTVLAYFKSMDRAERQERGAVEEQNRYLGIKPPNKSSVNELESLVDWEALITDTDEE